MNTPSLARKLLADALSMPEQDMPADIRIGSVDQWDSLAHARILLALEEKIGKPLAAAEAATVESVSEVEAILAKYAKDR